MSGFRIEPRVLGAENERARGLIVECASCIPVEPVEWLWPHRIAVGKLTLIAGEAGLGKSQVAIAMAAAHTTGAQWPCGEGTAPLGGVIFLSAEDSAADTVVPRLMAAGANLQHVHLVRAVQANVRRTFSLQSDLDLACKQDRRARPCSIGGYRSDQFLSRT